MRREQLLLLCKTARNEKTLVRYNSILKLSDRYYLGKAV